MKFLLKAAALLAVVAVLTPLLTRVAAEALPFLILMTAVGFIYHLAFGHTRGP